MKQSFKRLFLVPLLAAGFLLPGFSPSATASAASVLTLTATPNPSGNYVALNWTNSDKSQPYSYMLYSKSAHESTFQSIPAKDSAKVLNIYPIVAPTVSFTTWQGKVQSHHGPGTEKGHGHFMLSNPSGLRSRRDYTGGCQPDRL